MSLVSAPTAPRGDGIAGLVRALRAVAAKSCARAMGARVPGDRRTPADETIASLLQVPVFRRCGRRQLGRIARTTAVRDVPAGSVITRRGDPGHEFFCVIEGTATADVSPRRWRRLAPGDFFGEMSLIDGEPRSATVTAEQGMRLLVVDRRRFGALLDEAPDLALTLLATLSRRVREAERSC